MTYQSVLQAIGIIRETRLKVYKEEDASPAWSMLMHAGDYLTNQANQLMRGE